MMNDENDARASRQTQVLDLPAHARASDAAVHAVAERLLRRPDVRSVTIDENRAAALVRFKNGQRAAQLDELAACLAVDAVDHSIGASGTEPATISWFDPRDRSVSFVRLPPRVSGWRKAIHLLLAASFLLLGLIGIILPGLPTTPFVLLGSYFLLRSSVTLHQRLVASRLFGGILRDWHVHRGIRPHVRVKAIAVVAAVVLVSLALTKPALPITVAILALVACGLVVIWRLPTVKLDDLPARNQ